MADYSVGPPDNKVPVLVHRYLKHDRLVDQRRLSYYTKFYQGRFV